MAEQFTIIENDTVFEFEYENDGIIYLLNNEFSGSRVNLNGKKTRTKNIDDAKEKAREMLSEMGII